MPDDDLPKPDHRPQNEKFDDQFLRRYLLGQCSQIESDDLEQAVLLNGEVADLLSAIEDELTEEYIENALSETDLQCFKHRFFRTRARRDKIRLTAKLLGRDELLEAFALVDRPRSDNDEVPIWSDVFGLPPVSAKNRGYLSSEPEDSGSSEGIAYPLGGTENLAPLETRPPFGTTVREPRSGIRFLSNWRFALSLGVVSLAGLLVAVLFFMFTSTRETEGYGPVPHQKPSIAAENKSAQSSFDQKPFFDRPPVEPPPSTSGISLVSHTNRKVRIAVRGANFKEGSIVRWNGAYLDTSFVSASELQVSILTSSLWKQDTWQVIVVNPPPGFGYSAPLNVQNVLLGKKMKTSIPSSSHP